MSESDVSEIMSAVLLEFPLKLIDVTAPRWLQALSRDNGIIKELIGRECTIDGDGIYGHSCTILDADDEWVKLIVHEKKSDSTMIVRLDNIDSITLD